MIELSDSVREKLNNPEIIKGMAEQILIKAGTSKHYFLEDRGYYYDVPCFFTDFPAKKIHIHGYLDLVYVGKDSKLNVEMYDFLMGKSDAMVIKILNDYYHKFGDAKKDFSSVKISWDENPLIPNINHLKDTKEEYFKEGYKKNPKQHVFSYDSGKVNFEKGPWQEYLAQIYVSTLGFMDYWKFEKGEFDFLL